MQEVSQSSLPSFRVRVESAADTIAHTTTFVAHKAAVTIAHTQIKRRREFSHDRNVGLLLA